jgi:hypothetical protein
MSLNHWYSPSEQFPSKAEMPATFGVTKGSPGWIAELANAKNSLICTDIN